MQFNFILLRFILLASFLVPMISATGASTLKELATPCLACHSLEPDGATHVGPSLANVGSRPLGGDRGYFYSNAFTSKAAEGLVWDRDSLDSFLQNPQSMVEGTAMSFPGVPDAGHRAILLDWLLSDPSGKVPDIVDADYRRVPGVKTVMDIPADAEYGEYLAGECLTCHQSGDNTGGVPPILKLTTDYFIFALLEYQNGARSNRVMQSVAGALGAEEIAALSAVFTKK